MSDVQCCMRIEGVFKISVQQGRRRSLYMQTGPPSRGNLRRWEPTKAFHRQEVFAIWGVIFSHLTCVRRLRIVQGLRNQQRGRGFVVVVAGSKASASLVPKVKDGDGKIEGSRCRIRLGVQIVRAAKAAECCYATGDHQIATVSKE